VIFASVKPSKRGFLKEFQQRWFPGLAGKKNGKTAKIQS
jgi:hypothetical protein